MWEVLSLVEARAWAVLSGGLFLLTLELVFPASGHSWLSRIRALLFWGAYLAITASVLTLFGRVWAYLGITPVVILDLQAPFVSGGPIVRTAGAILGTILAAIIGDFFYYWFHRLQHSVPLLWRFHALHHSIEELNALNSNHHFTEEIFRIPFVAVPLSLLVPAPGPAPWLLATLMGMLGLYIHSSTRLHFGPLRYVIADNRFHRIHHSIEPRHSDKNFGSFSSVWDSAFGTAFFPKKDDWPDTGLQGIKEPESLSDFLWRPFRSTTP